MEIEVMNPAPTYAKLIDVINPEFSDILVDLVKRKGIKSNYSTNLNCREYKLPNVFTGSMSKEDVRIISHLHDIVEPIQALANQMFINTAMSKIITHAGFWLMEYSEGGTFGNHVDFSTDDDGYSTAALATFTVSLNDTKEFELYEGDEYIAITSPV